MYLATFLMATWLLKLTSTVDLHIYGQRIIGWWSFFNCDVAKWCVGSGLRVRMSAGTRRGGWWAEISCVSLYTVRGSNVSRISASSGLQSLGTACATWSSATRPATVFDVMVILTLGSTCTMLTVGVLVVIVSNDLQVACLSRYKFTWLTYLPAKGSSLLPLIIFSIFKFSICHVRIKN